MRSATEEAIALRYMLCSSGVPVTAPTDLYGDNLGITQCASIPDSDMKKKHVKWNLFMTAVYAVIHFGWIALFACGAINYGFVAFAWMFFFINSVLLLSVRNEFRMKLGISGNLVGDFVGSSFMYAQCLLQMEKQVFEFEKGHTDKDAFVAKEDVDADKLTQSDMIHSA